MSRRLVGILCVLMCGSLIGCDQPGGQSVQGDGDSAPVTRTAQRGPVKMSVTLNRDIITIADKLRLNIEVSAENGVEVEMPQFGDALSDFTIRNFRKWPPVPQEGLKLWRQEYELDVYLSGEYSIPAITASFVDRRDAEQGSGKIIRGEITTEPIAVQVESLLEGEFDPQAFRDIKAAVELPKPASHAWIWAGAIAVGVIGAVILLVLVRRRRARAKPSAVVPVHVWALDQLCQLEDRQGDVHELYFGLSRVIREYIERRFFITASQQTTEEFLKNMKHESALSDQHKGLLGEFLQACDLVKFALHEPRPEEVGLALQTAREFVRQTTLPQEPQEIAA